MPTEDRNTIDCTFQHSSLDIQFLNPSIPPSEFNIPAPPFPAFCFPCPNISSLGSNRRLLSPSFTRSIPTFLLSCPNIPPLGPSFLPPNPAFRHPIPIINPTFPRLQHSTPSMPAFHPSIPQCQHSSPSNPSFHPCPFNVHIPPSTCNLERAVGQCRPIGKLGVLGRTLGDRQMWFLTRVAGTWACRALSPLEDLTGFPRSSMGFTFGPE